MKWVESEADARAARDISIECMARIGDTIDLVRQSADDIYSAKYTRASAMLMGELVDIIHRAGLDFSNLVPSENEFEVIGEQRVPATELVPNERKIDADALRAVMTTVRERLAEIA